MYLPIRTPGGSPALFEMYRRQSAIEASGDRILIAIAPVVIGSLLLLWLIQLPLAWSTARRLRDGLRERQALLESALESSSLERRRVAADLHDGPVQNLAGLAFRSRRPPSGPPPAPTRTPSGRSRTAPTRPARASGACAPPWFTSIRAACTRPAWRRRSAISTGELRERGVAVDIEVPGDIVLAPAAEELLYRGAGRRAEATPPLTPVPRA